MTKNEEIKNPGNKNTAHESVSHENAASRLTSHSLLMALHDLPEAQKRRNTHSILALPLCKDSCYGPSELKHIRLILDVHSVLIGFTFDFITSSGDFWVNTADRFVCDDSGDHISLCPVLCEAITASLVEVIKPRRSKEPQTGNGRTNKPVSSTERG